MRVGATTAYIGGLYLLVLYVEAVAHASTSFFSWCNTNADGAPSANFFMEVQIMRRRKMNARKDRRMFSRTADKTRMINLYPVVMRGGFRL